eukprot:CAMPEP_0198291190 /NCGR_PEP_ID=MMETSP1449-20131203/8802_1 /TAXON_ID=420275 /ORGANISM="Attheya septentrionalis, Strain CCMP2084" /LENGTH=392 /DNA_ID=CAMNT_0043989795 /DNA_START=148 /DNA_END=1323 /DNA_ORIENTATION=-
MANRVVNASAWSLRGFHHRISSRDLSRSVKDEKEKVPGGKLRTVTEEQEVENQAAVDIFPMSGSGIDKITGIVDGREVLFELREDVTKTPTANPQPLEKSIININRSSWDMRLRWWLMTFHLPTITVFYLIMFLAVNFVFAALWSIEEGKCCGDANQSYTQIFDFAIQTSTTIGYGGYVPTGYFSNFLVVFLSFFTLILNTVFAGLLFLKFVSPSAKIEFSNVITMTNVNGIPCLEIRIGNADGSENKLLDASVRFTYEFFTNYVDEKGEQQRFAQRSNLNLLANQRNELDEIIWTLRHVVDEQSPLFGLNFEEYPGSSIIAFRLMFNATQDVTGAQVTAQTKYELDHVMVGHRFKDQVNYDPAKRTLAFDYTNFSETVPHPVWYPASNNEW